MFLSCFVSSVLCIAIKNCCQKKKKKKKKKGQQAMSLFTGAVIHGGKFNISINSLNQSPTLATPEAEIESTMRYKRLKVLDSDSE